MSIGGFFILLGLGVLSRATIKRVAPLLVPARRNLTVLAAMAGGFAASWLDSRLWRIGPEIAGIYLPAAVAGAFLVLLAAGLFPFVRIMLGRGD